MTTTTQGWLKVLDILNQYPHKEVGLCTLIGLAFQTKPYDVVAKSYHEELHNTFRPHCRSNAWWMGTDQFRRRACILLASRHNPISTRMDRVQVELDIHKLAVEIIQWHNP